MSQRGRNIVRLHVVVGRVHVVSTVGFIVPSLLVGLYITANPALMYILRYTPLHFEV